MRGESPAARWLKAYKARATSAEPLAVGPVVDWNPVPIISTGRRFPTLADYEAERGEPFRLGPAKPFTRPKSDG